MKAVGLTLFFTCYYSFILAQEIFQPGKHDQVWLIGVDLSNTGIYLGGTIIDFSTTPPAISYQERELPIRETAAGICDTNGNILFYSNGINIYNKELEIMVNGNGLNPGLISEDFAEFGYPLNQGALALPYPGSSYLFYLLHEKRQYGSIVTNFYYSLIDMSQNNELGQVVEKNISIIADTLGLGGLAACRHANGRDWWIVTPKEYSNLYYIFLLSPYGIELLQTPQVGREIDSNFGQNTFSADGKYYVRFNASGITPKSIDIFKFDRCSGILFGSQSIIYDDTIGAGGIAISENSRFLYVASGKYVYQFDLEAEVIEDSREIVAVHNNPLPQDATIFGLSQLGTDGKIYITTSWTAQVLHIIERPGVRGISSNVVQDGVSIPTINRMTVPNYPYFKLGPLDGSPCDTLNIDNPAPRANFDFVIEDSATSQIAFFDLSLFNPESWYWEFGDGQSSTERFPIHTYEQPGAYEVCLTVENVTGSNVFCDTINLLASKTQETIATPPGFHIFPNPAYSNLAVSSDRPFAGQRLSLYNVMGKEVIAHEMPKGITSFSFSVEGLPPGVYFLKVWEGAAAAWSAKVVVSKR